MSLAYFSKVRKSVKKLKLEDLIRNLKNALSKAHKSADRDFLLKHLTFLQEKGLDNPATKKDLDFILKDIEKTLGQKLESLAEAPILQASMEAYTEGKKKVCKPFKIDYSLDDADLGALDTLSNFNGWYIRDKFSKDTSDIINRELGDLLERGGTKREFAQTLETALEDHVTDSKQYWELLADHTLTKIQNMGHVSGYETAGVQYVKIVAVIDNKTTPICRTMNGKIFKVADFRKQYDKIIRAAEKHDLKAYKAAQPMISGKAMKGEISDEDIKRLGIKLPPYHFRCRTTHVAYFEGERELKQPERGKTDNKARSDGIAIAKPSAMTEDDKKNSVAFLSNKFKELSSDREIFNRGFRKLSIISENEKEFQNAYMYTYGDGRFAVSDKNHLVISKDRKRMILYNPLLHLTNAFSKIDNKGSLEYVEYIALKDFWHELWHNKQHPLVKLSKARLYAMETLNEYCARITFPDFLNKLKVKIKYQKELVHNAPAYIYLVDNLENMFNKYKVPKRGRFEALKNINLKSHQMDILQNMSKYIAENSGLGTSDWKDLSRSEKINKIQQEFSTFYESVKDEK